MTGLKKIKQIGVAVTVLCWLGACALDPVDVVTAPLEKFKKEVTTKEVNPHIAQRMEEAKDTGGKKENYPNITDVPLERPKRLTGTQRRMMKASLLAEGSTLQAAITDDTVRMTGLAKLEAAIVANAKQFDRRYHNKVERDAQALLRAVAADRRAAASAAVAAAEAEAAAQKAKQAAADQAAQPVPQSATKAVDFVSDPSE